MTKLISTVITPLWFAGILLICGGLFSPLISQAKNQPEQPLPLEELRAFSEVYYYVKSSYVEEIDDRALIKAAIKGMVSSLDNHSRYLDSSAFSNFTADNNGEYAGIGLSFADHTLGIQIDTVVKNGPADRQQLTKGMVVTRINDIDIKRISSDDAYKLLHGKVNSKLKLSILENAQMLNDSNADQLEAKQKDYFLTREVIYLPSITSDLLPTNIGYLAISQFTKKSPIEFIDAVNQLSTDQPIQKLIIDLRNNPGGVLESAIQISDLFIDSGTLLTSSGRTTEANEVFQASSIAPYMNLEVVVMMNAYSASSSEILAAALQDHHKATILGDISYGKGSIQSIYFLRQDSGLKITTAKYFSPNGHKIQDVGIQPDVMFKTAELENHQQTEILNDLELLQAFEILSDKKE
jgi:carboxyl-terminal processing protease